MAKGETFLGELAKTLYSKHGVGISKLTLLLPSQRARLFFCDELAQCVKGAIWEPEWLTIDSLMEEISGLRIADRLRLITELYKIYNKHLKEEFDHFYFWGDLLLSDFDMIDKYRVDADMLFRNISDLKELESDLSYLSEEQRQIINRFWEGVLSESADSKERREFMRVWNSLGPIYREFKARLHTLGLAYTGMIQRHAVELLDQGKAQFKRKREFVVAGFNALTTCEKRLFTELKTLGAEFYWDYDNHYLRNRDDEAGMFLRENIRLFGESQGCFSHDEMSKEKDIEVVSFPSNAAQSKYVSTLLDSLRAKDESGEPLPLDRGCAVVLTDESLLMPLIFSLESPKRRDSEEQIDDGVNVTMGFPLKRTTAYTFLERIIALQSHIRSVGDRRAFYHADVTGILSHPYISCDELAGAIQKDIVDNRRVSVTIDSFEGSPLLNSIFREVGTWQEYSLYVQELFSVLLEHNITLQEDATQLAMLGSISEELSKLHNSILECELDISTSIYTSLLRRHLSLVKIPFSGEPLKGLQIMGILETRNLDFESVILLSMTDDNFPGKLDSGASYIPYNLRMAYGLPTIEHHEGVYSYYFRRLLQRAKRVVMCYCSHADDKTTGEQSRYIRQLEYEGLKEHNLHFTDVGLDVNLPDDESITVEKQGMVRGRLEEFLKGESKKMISPTAFSRYVACPMRFYFASVAGLRAQDDISDDVDNPTFGTILHGSMEELYKEILDIPSPKKELQKMLQGDKIERVVDGVINKELLHLKSGESAEYSGNIQLVRGIVVKYIRGGVVPYDIKHCNFTVVGLEKPVKSEFKFDDSRSVLLGGTADRVDRMEDGSLRVIDYKTGGVHLDYNGLDALFKGRNRSSNANLLQTLLYSMALTKSEGVEAYPELYYVRKMRDKHFSPRLVDSSASGSRVSYSYYRKSFEESLAEQFKRLFNYDEPFTQVSVDEEDSICKYCDYKGICRRKE